MTTYKEIFGKQIKQVSSDPTDAQAEGQVWYNTTDGVFKTIVSAGAWSSGANLNTAGGGSGFGATINASARVLGPTLVTEEYNGSAWTTVNPASSAQGGFFGGSTSGTQTAAYIVGGRRASPEVDFGTTSTYDGTNWTTAPGSISPGRIGSSAHGTQTAGIAAAGAQSGVAGVLASTATFNGTAWTGAPSLGVARGQTDSIHGGTQTATITVSGERSPSGNAYNLHEQYDGSSWTAKTVMTSGGAFVSGSGGQDSYVAYAGSSSPAPSGDGNGAVTNRTIAWDGTAWTTQGSMAIANRYRASLATITSSSSALAAGGATPSNITSTEEYALSVFSPIAATWASGGSLNTKHNGASASGIQTAALVSGGNDGAAPDYSTVNSEEYNGTAWTEGNNRSVSVYNTMGSGSQTAALAFGGNKYTAGISNATEEYDGTSWTGGGTLNTATDAGIGFGLQTASVKAGGYGSPGASTNSSEEYDGSSWTAGNNINTARSEQPGGFGILTAGVMFGGGGSGTPGTVATTVEEYNGTNWSTVNSSSLGHSGAWAAGTQTDGIGGGGGPTTTSAELYDGTNWATAASLSTGRSFANGLGTPSTASSALVSAGEPSRKATEEFTGEVVLLNKKTLTSS